MDDKEKVNDEKMDDKKLSQQETRHNRRLFWGGLFIGWVIGMVTIPLSMLCKGLLYLTFGILTGNVPHGWNN
jgi:hypothetical protein